jgi:SdrD B-like domain
VFAYLSAPTPTRRPRPRRLAFEVLGDRITPTAVPLPPSQVSGLVYVDQDRDAVADDTEPRLAGVTVTLTGTSADGDAVNLTTTTDLGGIYMFQGLEAGNYNIRATTPAGYVAGQSSVGAFGGTPGPNVTTNIAIPGGQSSGGYNFGQLTPPPAPNPCPPPPTCPPKPPCDTPRPRKDCDRGHDRDDDCKKERKDKDRDCKDDRDKGHNKDRDCRDDDDRGKHKNKDRCDRDDRGRDNDCRPKGNNGVGNGQDPQPRGNPPINDGPGTSPGNPGNRGGAKR